MNVYKVTYKSENTRIIDNDADYIEVDKKIAYKCILEERLVELEVEASNVEDIQKEFPEYIENGNVLQLRNRYDLTIEFIKEKEFNVFDKCRPSDYVRCLRPSFKTLRDIKEVDCFCDEKVQIRYSKLSDSQKAYMLIYKKQFDYPFDYH